MPAYSSFEASHYLRVPPNTIRNWAIGYTYPTQSGGSARARVAVRLFPFTRGRDVGTTLESPRLIAIDPAVAFGRPVIAGSRVPTSEIAERFQAGESPNEIAKDFGRTQEETLEALRCEFPAAA